MKIDFHYHYADVEGFVEGLLKEMDDSRVDITLLMGGPEEAFWEYKNCRFASNEKVLKAVKAHPDRLIGNVYLDPREPDAMDIFARYMDEGCKSVKMFPPVGFMPDDERFFPLYEKIEKQGVSLLFHAVLYGLVHTAAEGSTSWFRLWSPERFYPTSCDFSYMISPKMFRSLFLPVIERWTHSLDHSVYHVDGVEAFKHVPALADLPGIQAFQILPGAGKPSPLHYLDTLRLVQARGKNLHITIGPEEVEPALELLSARGLFISTSCESEEQARFLLKMAEKWSHE